MVLKLKSQVQPIWYMSRKIGLSSIDNVIFITKFVIYFVSRLMDDIKPTFSLNSGLIFLNVSKEMQMFPAPVLNNQLWVSPWIDFRWMIGIGLVFVGTSLISLISLNLSLMHVSLLKSKVVFKSSCSSCFDNCGLLETFSFLSIYCTSITGTLDCSWSCFGLDCNASILVMIGASFVACFVVVVFLLWDSLGLSPEVAFWLGFCPCCLVLACFEICGSLGAFSFLPLGCAEKTSTLDCFRSCFGWIAYHQVWLWLVLPL